MTGLQRKDFYLLAFLFLVVLLIFFPLFYTDYIYTDEAVQLWLYWPGSDFSMFAAQGRWITELLIAKSFKAINTIHGITYIRIFGLAMWLVCLPVWYTIVKRIAARGPGYEYLPFFTCLYLVTSLQFSITVQWASCIELPIANTAGLLSGAILYLAIRDNEKKWSLPVPAGLGAAVAGLVSLSTYQSGFGCFLVPFLFHYISAYTTRKEVVFVKGLAFYFLMYAVYFVLFKVWVTVNHVASDPRTGFTAEPFDKLLFFFSHPLKRAFWFNIIIDGDNKLGRAAYKVLLVGWMLLAFIRFGKAKWLSAIKYIVAVLLVFMISYLPSLVVKESYSSNRTLLAINMCVWIVCAEMVLYIVKSIQLRRIVAFSVATVLLISGWYNFNRQFLKPIHEEYMAVKNHVQQHYNKNITTVYFIKPTEDAFSRKHHLQISMDEFGVPSTFFEWVPEPLMQQMVAEITGDRQTGQKLTVKFWPDKESFTQSGEAITNKVLVLNVPELIDPKISAH
ncbi:hypothetical protein FAM09_21460 [Niastella caeni]|uniref:Glycosyltransferase family 39 protein n=1 Tax=Niastella caeni TaxID=2569763 RepID=A0A4S8HS82_9BACT|nr:hypothetical protein [Niastella caeni]THU35962.1 hypothetical protein FAM09_21460 [Niastella caeni]